MEEYGESRLMQSVADHHHLIGTSLHQALYHDVKTFVKDAPQHDDMTIVVIKGL